MSIWFEDRFADPRYDRATEEDDPRPTESELASEAYEGHTPRPMSKLFPRMACTDCGFEYRTDCESCHPF